MVPLFLTAISASLYAASFPPASLGILAWVALAPWLAAATLVSPRRAAALGAFWGMLATYGVMWWFPGMLSDYFEFSQPVGWASFVVASFVLVGIYCALFSAWVSWLARRGHCGPLVIAAGWVTYEFARAGVWVGNPWALIGYSQTDFTALLQIADLGGPYAVGFLLAAVNVLAASAFVPTMRSQWPRASSGTVAAVLLTALGYGQWRLSETFTSAEPFQVAVVQGAVERGFSWRPEYTELGLGRYLGLTRKALVESPDLVIWPEQAVGFYVQERSAESMILLGKTKQFGPDLIFGGPHYAVHPTGTRYHNSAFLLRGGRVAGRYDKQHLLPIAEEPLFGVVGYRRVDYSPGTPALLDTRYGRAGTFLCFEALYPELVRQLVLDGADLLVNLSNDAWLGSPAAARQHLSMAAVRAIENRRYLVRATSTGFSAVVDPHGRVLAETSMGTAEILIESIRPSSAVTPYHRWGDAPAWLAVVTVLGVTVAAGVRREI